jgi:DNA-directed RNA polymerase specialized sigma24 family protein
MVRNTALTWLRRAKTAPQASFDEEMHGLGSEAATVEFRFVEGAGFAVLRDGLNLLPVEFREVVVMREMGKYRTGKSRSRELARPAP